MNLEQSLRLRSLRMLGKSITAGGPGSGRHSIGTVAQSAGYTKEGKGYTGMKTYTHPKTGAVIEHYTSSNSWTHQTPANTPGNLSKTQAQYHGLGHGGLELENHLRDHMEGAK